MMTAGGDMHLLFLGTVLALLGDGAGWGGTDGEVMTLRGAPRVAPGFASAPSSAPVFATLQETTVRAVEGRSATLKCRVLQLGDKAVSWVRVRDLQILSHGGVVFTADSRVSVPPFPSSSSSPSPSAMHALRIDRLRPADAGRYECQLNTEPKMSLFFDLFVTDEAEAVTATESVIEPEMWGEDEVAVWAVESESVTAVIGGEAELACAARVLHEPLGAAPPIDIRWLREGKPLTLQEGWSVSRVSGARGAESRLRLVGLRARHAGDYTCAAGLAPTAAVATTTLHLTLSDQENMGEMEAMQRDQSVGGAAGLVRASLTLATTLVLTIIMN